MTELNEGESPLWSQVNRYKIPLALSTISVGVITLSLFILFKTYSFNDPIDIPLEQSVDPESAVSETIVVDVSGAVRKPGVYRLIKGSRITEAIAEAGGLHDKADLTYWERDINRAMVIADGFKIYLPFEGEVLGENHSVPNAVTSHNVLSGQTGGNLLSINSATKDELETLPDIGPVTADKIISGRPYSRVEDILERKIVGNKTFLAIKDMISL